MPKKSNKKQSRGFKLMYPADMPKLPASPDAVPAVFHPERATPAALHESLRMHFKFR